MYRKPVLQDSNDISEQKSFILSKNGYYLNIMVYIDSKNMYQNLHSVDPLSVGLN